MFSDDKTPGPRPTGFLVGGSSLWTPPGGLAAQIEQLSALEQDQAAIGLLDLLLERGEIDQEFFQHLMRSPIGRTRLWKVYQAGRADERAAMIETVEEAAAGGRLDYLELDSTEDADARSA